jgi:hypothetical protein
MNCKNCLKELETKNGKFCSLSCGSTFNGNIKKLKTIKNYELNPKFCPTCKVLIPYEKRFINIYCSHSCAAKINNIGITRNKKIQKQKEDRSHHVIAMKKFQVGEVATRLTLRKCLIKTIGNFCFNCKQEPIWDGKSLTMTVDHIDGNAGNNLPSNLRLLCPNCNSQSATFCGRNKGNGRGSRGLPLH